MVRDQGSNTSTKCTPIRDISNVSNGVCSKSIVRYASEIMLIQEWVGEEKVKERKTRNEKKEEIGCVKVKLWTRLKQCASKGANEYICIIKRMNPAFDTAPLIDSTIRDGLLVDVVGCAYTSTICSTHILTHIVCYISGQNDWPPPSPTLCVPFLHIIIMRSLYFANQKLLVIYADTYFTVALLAQYNM